jgi:hypothetical protein
MPFSSGLAQAGRRNTGPEDAEKRFIPRSQPAMLPRLPAHLVPKASPSGGPDGGPARVNLVLKNGRIIYDVFVGQGGEIAMAGGRLVFEERDLKFRPAEIVDVRKYWS